MRQGRARGHAGLGMSPLPPGRFPPDLVGGGGWAPFAPNATANTQVGAYSCPPRTQYPTNLPDRQLNCGVEGLNRNYLVPSSPASPTVPYFQQTTYPQNPRHLLQSGNRSGGVQQGLTMAGLYTPRDANQAAYQQALANGALGF